MNGNVSMNLVVIRALNPEAVCRFYEALGLRFSREQHGKGPVHHACDLGCSVFEIYPRSDSDSLTTATRIGFAVPSLDDALDALRGEDAVIMSGPTMRRAVLWDPEGHRVELVENSSSSLLAGLAGS